MTDAFSIQTHSWSYLNANIDGDRLSSIQNSATAEEAKTTRTLFEKITDWLNITHIDKAFEALHTLTHDSDTPLTSKQLFEKLTALRTFHDALLPEYRDNLKMECNFDVDLDNHQPIYESDYLDLNIKLTSNDGNELFHSTFSLGDYQAEMEVIKEQPLTNGGQFLAENLKHLPIEEALSHVTYVQKNSEKGSNSQKLTAADFEVTGTRDGNLKRLNFNLLSPETLIKFSQEPKLVQEWVANQMKIFDFVGEQGMEAQQAIMPFMPRTDLEGHWSTHAMQMIPCYAHDNALSRPFANDMNQKVDQLNNQYQLV